MKFRTPSKKAETVYRNLLYDARDHNVWLSENPSNGTPGKWSMANMPIEGESRTLLKDLEALSASRRKFLKTSAELGVESSISLADWEAVDHHIKQRIAVLQEIYGLNL